MSAIRGKEEVSRGRWLTALLLAAFVLRVWGLHYGLEEGIGFHPDANWYANKALDVYRGNWPSPWHQESGWVYWQAGLLYTASVIVFAIGGAAGVYHSLGEVNLSWDNLVLIVRLGNAVVGAATVAVVYRIGRRLFDARAGLAAAAIQTFSLLHVLNAHNHYNEVVMTFFILSAVLFAVRAVQTGWLRDYVFLVLLALVAAWVKKPGIVALGLLPGAYLARKIVRREWPGRRDLLAVGVVGVLYLVITRWRGTSLWGKWKEYSRHYWSPLTPWFPEGGMWDTPWLLQMSSIRFYMGDILTLAAVIAIVWALVRRNRPALAMLLAAGTYFAVIGGYMWADPRFILPVLPLLALVLAWACDDIAARWFASERLRGAAVGSLVVLLVLPSAYRAVVHDYLFWLPDTRILAGRWIREHVPEGRTIWVEGLNIYNPPIYDGRYSLIGYVPSEKFAESLAKADFFVASEIATQNSSAAEAFVRERSRLVKEFRFIGHQFHQPHIRVYHLRTPSGAPRGLADLLPRAGRMSEESYSVLFREGGGYDRDVFSRPLHAGVRWTGALVSKDSVSRAWAIVTNGERAKTVRIGTGFFGRGMTFKLRPHETRVAEIQLRRGFPFFDRFYRISVSTGPEAGGHIWILTDPIRAASAALEIGEAEKAFSIIETAAAGPGAQAGADVLRTVAATWAGRDVEPPGRSGLLSRLEAMSGGPGDGGWETRFKKEVGLDWRAYVDSITDRFDGKTLSRQTGLLSGGEALFRAGVDQPGFLAFGPYRQYLPGSYVAEFNLRVRGRKGMHAATVDVFGAGSLGEKSVTTGGENAWKEVTVAVPFSHYLLRQPIEFRVRATGEGDVAVRSIHVRPEAEKAFLVWRDRLHEALAGETRDSVRVEAGVRFEGGIEHLGTRVDRGDFRRGEPIRFQYAWRAVKPIRKEYEVFVHVEREGKIIFQQDHLFEGGARSVRSWSPGEVVTEEFIARIPEDAPPGEYAVYVGLIDGNSREPVTLSGVTGGGRRIAAAAFSIRS